MTREYYNLIKNIIQNTSGEVTSKIFLPIPQKEHHPDETRRMSKNAKKKLNSSRGIEEAASLWKNSRRF